MRYTYRTRSFVIPSQTAIVDRIPAPSGMGPLYKVRLFIATTLQETLISTATPDSVVACLRDPAGIWELADKR